MSSDVEIITPKICKVKITTVEKGIIYSTKQRIIAQPIVDWNFRGNLKLPTKFSVHPRGLPLSKAGIIAEQALQKWNETYENVYLSSYVIMPNHLHIMVVILPNEDGGRAKRAPTVSTMINQFKGAVTKQLGENIWQKLFYGHIIRDKCDFNEISKYILENPLKWQFDELYCE